MKIKILILVFSLGIQGAFSQDLDEEINIAGFRFLDYSNQLPENFLSTKAAVFVTVPPASPQTSERGDWKGLSEKAHRQFKRMGIDAVGYYYMDDLKSGTDPALFFAAELKKRKIENIILLSRVPLKIKGKPTERFVMVITPFNGENSFISHGQKAWKKQSKELEKVLKELGKDVYRSKQPKTNFLINDFPEFFEDADAVKGRRIPTYARDLKVRKLAISKSSLVEIPENRPGGLINKKVEKEIEEYNKKVVRDNARLESILKTYPLEYEIVEGKTDKELYDAGFQYVLVKLNTTGTNIRRMLDYEIDPAETDFVTVKSKDGRVIIRSIPVNAPIYKYYVKHLYTKDVYVGTEWDADETWDDALQNFISKMKKDLKLD